jgi:hypothetical protein
VIGGIPVWMMTSEQYIKAVIANVNVETKLDKEGQCLPSRCLTPMKSGDQPEIDVSKELKIEGIRYYQELIRIMRWAIELGPLILILKFHYSHLTLRCLEQDIYNKRTTSLDI